jgi:hypothetical protein
MTVTQSRARDGISLRTRSLPPPKWRGTSRSSSTPSTHALHSSDHGRVMRLGVLVPVAAVLAAASCGAGHGSAADDRAIAIYSAVIRAVSTEPTSTPPTTTPSGPVFVVAAAPRAPISLEVQAGVVDELHGFATIRFVDDRSEAIDTGVPHEPVHDHGVLIALGKIPRGRTDVTIEAQRYERTNAAFAYRVRLHRIGATWHVVQLSVRDGG